MHVNYAIQCKWWLMSKIFLTTWINLMASALQFLSECICILITLILILSRQSWHQCIIYWKLMSHRACVEQNHVPLLHAGVWSLPRYRLWAVSQRWHHSQKPAAAVKKLWLVFLSLGCHLLGSSMHLGQLQTSFWAAPTKSQEPLLTWRHVVPSSGPFLQH